MPEWRFDINPVAASRPRVGKWGAYYTGTYKEFREEAAAKVYEVLGTDLQPLSGPLAVSIELYVKRPKSTERGWPKADIDNFAKAVLDTMNKKVWDDDSQIISIYVTKQWAAAGEDGYFTLSVNEQ
jgi:Holliday junction resolvase RusA-like endonuclease